MKLIVKILKIVVKIQTESGKIMLEIEPVIFRGSLIFLSFFLFIYLSLVENMSKISFIVFRTQAVPEVAKYIKIPVLGVLISSAMRIVGNLLVSFGEDLLGSGKK